MSSRSRKLYLPPEVIAHIAKTLSPKNVIRLSLASKATKNAAAKRLQFLRETRRKRARAAELRPAGERRAKRRKL